jgi:glycosyltransferase involved in cell wall biosynthesis
MKQERIVMTSLSDVSLIIATYNEGSSLDYVLSEIESYDFKEVIIVDGHSVDNTVEIAKKHGAKVFLQTTEGWGAAVLEGFQNAKGKYLTYMDGDGSYRPTSIIEMKNNINKYDVVFGSRYKGGAKSPDDTFIRSLGNSLFTYIVRKVFQIDITDSLFFFPFIKKIDFDKIEPKSKDFTICIEIPVLLKNLGLNYLDLLSTERKRYAGVTKVHAFIDGTKILYGIVKLKLRI